MCNAFSENVKKNGVICPQLEFSSLALFSYHLIGQKIQVTNCIRVQIVYVSCIVCFLLLGVYWFWKSNRQSEQIFNEIKKKKISKKFKFLLKNVSCLKIWNCWSNSNFRSILEILARSLTQMFTILIWRRFLRKVHTSVQNVSP